MKKNFDILKKNPSLAFKRYSRKKFAAFNSLNRIVKIGVLTATCSIIVSPFKVFAQRDTVTFSKVIDLEEAEIVGQKSPTLLEELPRMVAVVTQKEIECAPSLSISDQLRYISNIDVKQRGKSGIQSDISIRGGSFDQSMILFNGTNISDPQSGHLSLFLPMEVDAISRVEILNGPAAQLYGANAFSGAVNFVTIPSETPSAKITAEYGDYGFLNFSATLNYSLGKIRNLLSIGSSRSDGYVSNTDFKKQNIFYQALYPIKEGTFDLQFGYSDRAFGANGFYTPKYPDQFEENQMTFVSASFTTGSRIKFQSKVSWRRHRDKFELFREDDEWYRIQNGITISNDTARTKYDTISWYSNHNHHINDVFCIDLSVETKSRIGTTSVGANLRSENILSTNIGYDRSILIPVRGYPGVYYSKSDSRSIFNLFTEQTIDFKPFFIAAGASLHWNSYMPDEVHFLPGIDFRYDINRFFSAIASYNYTIGLPTFTDLHYKDPNNEGNLDLKPYSQNSFEGGLRFNYEANLSTVSYFYNTGKNIIDWVWFSDRNIYRPVNIANSSTQGIEVSGLHNFARQFGSDFIIQSIRVNYTYLDLNRNIPGDAEKYVNARQMFSAMLELKFFKNLTFTGNYSYVERKGTYITYNFNSQIYQSNSFHPYSLVDARLSYNFSWFTIFGEGTNILNKKYVDVGSINQPGRWLVMGVKINLTTSNGS